MPASGSYEAVADRLFNQAKSRENAMVAVPVRESGGDELAAATLELRWGGGETNWFHVLAASEGWFCGPGAFIVREGRLRRLGDSA